MPGRKIGMKDEVWHTKVPRGKLIVDGSKTEFYTSKNAYFFEFFLHKCLINIGVVYHFIISF